MALALNNLKRVDMPLKQRNQTKPIKKNINVYCIEYVGHVDHQLTWTHIYDLWTRFVDAHIHVSAKYVHKSHMSNVSKQDLALNNQQLLMCHKTNPAED